MTCVFQTGRYSLVLARSKKLNIIKYKTDKNHQYVCKQIWHFYLKTHTDILKISKSVGKVNTIE